MKGIAIPFKIVRTITLFYSILWLSSCAVLLNFEKGVVEKTDIDELTLEGYTFLDRNENGQLDIYEDDRKPTQERVEDVLSQMSRAEKIHLLKGSGIASALGRGNSKIPGAVGTIVPTPRLGIPTIYLSDGPAGLRIQPKRKGEERSYYCTAFPVATLLSSTWNTSLVEEVGAAMGLEAKEYGIDVILGPGVNIHRYPLCGRNFEYYSEDPVLTGYIGAAMVNGIESQGVGSSVKHFVANNQETKRMINDAIVSGRAMREIYLKPFKIIVENSQPWTIMSSYNRVNGIYTSESRELLSDILREEWNFEGLVMTDWFGGKSAPVQIKAGNNLLEPGTKKQWKQLKKAARKEELADVYIDTSVRRILNLIMQSQKMQDYEYQNNPDLTANAEVTRRAATEGMVLLKNKGTLPMKNVKNIALLGHTSYDFIAGGTGSGDVNEAYTISLEQGLEDAGFKINTLAKTVFERHKKRHKKRFKKPKGFVKPITNPYNPPEVDYSTEDLSKIVESADIGIITLGRNSGEAGDRFEKDDFLLSQEEQDMVAEGCKAFQQAGKKVIVVLNIGGVIETASWKERPDAILLSWQGGQEGGNSATDILTGVVNPSGKLPMTFPNNLTDHASHSNFPKGKKSTLLSLLFGFNSRKEKKESKKQKNIDYTSYEEGIYVGYRHFDKLDLAVSYPFGYGLSYTSFEFSDLKVRLEDEMIKVLLKVKNTGQQAGKEVVQVYTSKPDSKIDAPLKELRAFAKTESLKPAEMATLKLSIPVSELSYWSEKSSKWELRKGNYTIQVGSSSRDIKLSSAIDID